MDGQRIVAISGASGMVGTALTQELEADGIRVLQLVRRPVKDSDTEVYWRPSQGEIDGERLEGVDTVFHLAGKGIANERWTAEVKKQIVESRTKSTQLLAQTLANLNSKPRVLVSASAVGYYGNRGTAPVDEDSEPGQGFLAETCQAWEAACQPAWEAGIRVAQVRIGIVLSPKGGALAKMLPVFKLGAGGVLGSGDQYMSWISLPDLTRALRFVADNDAIHGAVNGVAPKPVTNREFTKILAKKLGRPALVPAPAFALKLAMGEMAGPLLLQGASVQPKRLNEAGFHFETPDLGSAIDRVLS